MSFVAIFLITFAVKNASGKVVPDGEKTKAVWQDYMEKLMNEENVFVVVNVNSVSLRVCYFMLCLELAFCQLFYTNI